ncbi:MAG TPA: FAD-dependent oxidoreductase, partial [Dehalococcoidia bacterium]|nr:FAD-dependent oxidoreductase [Dehalococcoidia bacterium]
MAKVYIRGAGIHATGTIAMVNKTGSWRYLRPVHEEKMPPCNNACPAGNNIQGFIKLIREEKLLDAWRLIKETSPLPGICGRVCPHPCEKECNRGKYDEAMAIHTLERMVADYAYGEKVTEKAKTAPKKEKIAIVGSGPAGLSCAYFLAKEGYQVTVFESLPEIGGMLRVGIPRYRLPRKILDKEIADIKVMGVNFKTNSKIKDISELKDYDAVFVGTGAHISRKLDVPGENTAGVISGTEFLRQLNLDSKAKIGKNVIVVGGGNTAIDAARSA